MKRLTLAFLALLCMLRADNIIVNGSWVMNGTINYGADAGGDDTYVVALSPPITTCVTGAVYAFSVTTANTGAATVDFGCGAKTIKKNGGSGATDLADNDIKAGQFVLVQYDGTNMQMQSTLGNAGGAGSSAFSAITGSTNTSAAMVVGTGASIATSGSGTINATKLVDSAQLDALLISATASSVNQITIKPSATTAAPQIQATGTDTNISMQFVPKGTGAIILPDAGFYFLSSSADVFKYRAAGGGFTYTVSGTKYISFIGSGPVLNNASRYMWTSGDSEGTLDTGLGRAGAAYVEVNNSNNGTIGSLRAEIRQHTGSAVASATTTTLGLGNVFHITGTTTITTLNTCDSANTGRQVTLIFDGALTFTDGNNLKLAGNFTTTADDTITLACDGTNWYEQARAVN